MGGGPLPPPGGPDGIGALAGVGPLGEAIGGPLPTPVGPFGSEGGPPGNIPPPPFPFSAVTIGALRSFVSVFFNFFPFWI
jgi:hypothetical protein